ncbi:Gfo/Idh/MocA family oxidoreductase [Thalassospira sp. MA62]|nr:Gfo/Idh/MocA family oxidoreductase [Thalassospira sp. MA62]
MTEMKALLRFAGARKIVLAQCPIPSPSDTEILAQTTRTVISPGTEFQQARQTTATLWQKAWLRPDLVALTFNSLRKNGPKATFDRVQNRLNRPMPMGYCAVGIIRQTGNRVTDMHVGQRVAMAGMGSANHAQWNVVSQNLCCPVPDGVDDDQACFATLYALVLHALQQGETSIGHKIAIIGGGVIGLIVAQVATCAGASIEIVDPNGTRRHKIASVTQKDAHGDLKTLPKDCFDAVYICAPATGNHDLIDQAAHLCRDRGTIVCVGDVAPNGRRKPLYDKEITLRQVRSYGPGRYDPAYEAGDMDYPIGHVRWTVKRHMQAALALMADGRLDPRSLISREIAFDTLPDHYSKASQPNDLAVLVRYDQSPPDQTDHHTNDQNENPVNRAVSGQYGPDCISLGVIGAGNYAGGVLLPILRRKRDVNLQAVTSKTGLSALAFARKFKTTQVVSDHTAILSDRDINTVLIATRHDSHAELARLALEAGKHVWLEKPIAIDQAGLHALRNCAPAPQTIFMIGHNRRHARLSRMLKNHLPDGPFQMQYAVRVNALPDDHWLHAPKQGNRALGEISHFIDLATFFAGTRITQLSCQWLDRSQGDSIWSIIFENGSRAEISYLQTPHPTAKEIITISAPGFDACLRDWRQLQVNGRTVARHWLAQDKGQFHALDVFTQSILAGNPDPTIVPLADEIDLMARIIDAANHNKA